MPVFNLRARGGRVKRRPYSRRELLAVYRDVKAEEREKRARPNEIREHAWVCFNATKPGKWPFWRHGFRAHYSRRVDRHDYAVIPGYDLLAQEVAYQFSEFEGEAGCEKLWGFLMSPHNPMPPKSAMLAAAKRRLREMKRAARAARSVAFDFGQPKPF